MANLALALLLLLAVAASASAAASVDLDLGFLASGGGARRECRGTVAECLAEDEEAELGSASAESHRRAAERAGRSRWSTRLRSAKEER